MTALEWQYPDAIGLYPSQRSIRPLIPATKYPCFEREMVALMSGGEPFTVKVAKKLPGCSNILVRPFEVVFGLDSL